jgi:hypothetical protein
MSWNSADFELDDVSVGAKALYEHDEKVIAWADATNETRNRYRARATSVVASLEWKKTLTDKARQAMFDAIADYGAFSTVWSVEDETLIEDSFLQAARNAVMAYAKLKFPPDAEPKGT